MLCRLLMVGNLTKAARAMNISRPAASLLLAQVRDLINFEKN